MGIQSESIQSHSLGGASLGGPFRGKRNSVYQKEIPEEEEEGEEETFRRRTKINLQEQISISSSSLGNRSSTPPL